MKIDKKKHNLNFLTIIVELHLESESKLRQKNNQIKNRIWNRASLSQLCYTESENLQKNITFKPNFVCK